MKATCHKQETITGCSSSHCGRGYTVPIPAVDISECEEFTQLSPVRVYGYPVRVRCMVMAGVWGWGLGSGLRQDCVAVL